MGIPGLGQIIDKYCSSASNKCTVADLRGKKIAIDISINMYQYASNATTRRDNFYLMGFFSMFHELLRNKVIPVVISDGKPGPLKSAIIKQRQEARKIKLSQIEDLKAILNNCNDATTITKTTEKLDKLNKGLVIVTREMFDNVYQLCDYLGIQVIHAVGEADALCAKLSIADAVDGVLSEDMDFLPFGCKKLIRGFKAKPGTELNVYTLDHVLSGLNLTHKQFVDMCILLGCDYRLEGLTGLGKKSAYQLLKEYSSIEAIITGLNLTPSNKFNYVECRHEFIDAVNRQPLVEISNMKEPDYIKLREFLIDVVGYKDTGVDKRIKELKYTHNYVPLINNKCTPNVTTHKPIEPKTTTTNNTMPNNTMPNTTMPNNTMPNNTIPNNTDIVPTKIVIPKIKLNIIKRSI